MAITRPLLAVCGLVLSVACETTPPPTPPTPKPQPPTSITPAPVAAAPSGSASSTPSAPVAAPTIDRKTCKSKPPAVKFEVTDDDLVIALDADGCPMATSYFKANGYGYKASVDFVVELQSRLKSGDHARVAELVNFPLRVNSKTPLVVKDKAAFLKSFDEIFPKALIDWVQTHDSRDVFCNSKGIMLGDGPIWASNRGGHYGVSAINPL